MYTFSDRLMKFIHTYIHTYIHMHTYIFIYVHTPYSVYCSKTVQFCWKITKDWEDLAGKADWCKHSFSHTSCGKFSNLVNIYPNPYIHHLFVCYPQHYKSADLQHFAGQFDLGLKAMNIILEGLAHLMFGWEHFQIIFSGKLHSFTMIRFDCIDRCIMHF